MSVAITSHGKATIHGVAGTFDVIVYPVQQKLKMTQNFELEVGKDVDGADAWWLARNENGELDIGVKFVADTAAHAIVPVSTGAGVLSTLGQPFLAPLATVTLSTFTLPALNGAYQNLSGSSLDLENTKVGDGDYKLRRYADSGQNTAATTAST